VEPRTFDRYEVKKLIGTGATGKVYLAVDPKLSRNVAVKVLMADANDSVRRRFRLEAKAIAALKHPNIVALHDYSGEESHELFLVMEYVPGRSLYETTRDYGPMSEPTALCVGHEIALGLEHAHQHHVIHRDIKPENILLHQGRVVLTDFGGIKLVADANRGDRHRRTEALGTPGFMAPEQFDGHDIGVHTDIFALGAVLYNLTTGQVPYQGGSVYDTYKNLKSGKYVDPREHRQLLSPEFARTLSRCLAPRIRDRFKSVQSLRKRLLVLMGQHGVVEAREELARYEKAPAGHAVSQRQRSVDVLLKDLQDAFRRRDTRRARLLIERIEALAPLDERMQEVTGLSDEVIRRRSRMLYERKSFWIGIGLGALVGALAASLAFLL